jgi:DNA-binding NarL/FixJ family response regulator
MHVLVIDDHPIIVEGCRHMLLRAGFTTIQYARGLADGFRSYREERPGLILMDLAFGSRPLAGLSFIRRLRLVDPLTPVLVFSMHDDPLIASQALKLGANGYLVKDAAPEELIKASTALREGRPYLSHELAAEIAFMEARRRTTNPVLLLTSRELKILSQLIDGKSYAQIADNLLISYKTVANTFSRLKAKLGARSLPELMQIAMQHLPSTQEAKIPPVPPLGATRADPKPSTRRRSPPAGKAREAS